jgi:hypothetical protein
LTFFSVDGGRSRIFSTTSQGACHRRFVALMVGTPVSLAPPPRGSNIDILALMVGTPGSPTSPPRGPIIDVFCIDSGHSQISGIASYGAHHRSFLRWWWTLPDLRHRLPGGLPLTFFALVVDVLISPAPPPRGAAVDIFCTGGGHSWISDTASQGPHCRHF